MLFKVGIRNSVIKVDISMYLKNNVNEFPYNVAHKNILQIFDHLSIIVLNNEILNSSKESFIRENGYQRLTGLVQIDFVHSFQIDIAVIEVKNSLVFCLLCLNEFLLVKKVANFRVQNLIELHKDSYLIVIGFSFHMGVKSVEEFHYLNFQEENLWFIRIGH